MQSSTPKDTTISSNNGKNLNLTIYPVVSPKIEKQ